tara:strand:+ start:12 stop:500 length:489 start_codon:yes stop_codon:yes gene_type:complete
MPRGRKPKADIRDELLKIRKKYGSLSASAVVTEAKKKRHPLHSFFNWDDTDAAKKWRLHQANMLIVRAKITFTTHEQQTIKVFISVTDEENGRNFVYTADAVQDKELMLQLFDQLHTRIENIEAQLTALSLLKGATATALKNAKTPIKRRKQQLQRLLQATG